MAWLERGYKGLLAWGLRHRFLTLVLAGLSLVVAVALTRFVQTEFVPQPDNNELFMTFYTPVGSSLELTEQKAVQAEKILREFPGVVQTYVTVNTGLAQGKNYATLFATLVPRTERPLSVQQLRKPVREKIGQIAGITITDLGNLSSVGSGKPIQLSIQGPDQKVLDGIAVQAIEKIKTLPGLVDLDTSSKPAKPVIAIEPNRALASDLGISINQISNALRPLLAGEAATTWKAPDDENYDVKVRLERSNRNSLGDLDRLSILSSQAEADGTPRVVPLRQVASISEIQGAAQINRKNLTREVLISANAQDIAPGTVGTQAQELVKSIPLPPGYAIVTGGATKDMQESFSYAVQALALGIIFIYMILASQFGSFLQPVSIMASLPLSLVGVVAALVAWRSSLNMFSIIGFIMLMGLVTKNAILLVDYTNQRRRAGIARNEALLSAAEVRLRPILMTTLAMVFGMIPLAVGVGEGSEQRAPLAHAVIGGVIASTLLTLLVVPVLYALLDGAVTKLKHRFGKIDT